MYEAYKVKNFDGALISQDFYPPLEEFGKNQVIWLHYTDRRRGWEDANNFVTFCFQQEDIEVKVCGVRLICTEDIVQHGGFLRVNGDSGLRLGSLGALARSLAGLRLRSLAGSGLGLLDPL
ncbi:hypothetical protein Tco_1095765 [Tanacetum coccineum]